VERRDYISFLTSSNIARPEWFHSLFNSAVVVFNRVVSISVCPPCEIVWQFACLLQRCHGSMRGGILDNPALKSGMIHRHPRSVAKVIVTFCYLLCMVFFTLAQCNIW